MEGWGSYRGEVMQGWGGMHNIGVGWGEVGHGGVVWVI